MSDLISRIPFFKLLIPVIVAILINYYLAVVPFAVYIAVVGAIVMIISFTIKRERQFLLRWLYGLGLNIFIIGLISMIFSYHDKQSTYTFSDDENYYVGYIMDIPSEKPRSVACNIRLKYPNDKKVIVYLQKDSFAYLLAPGDEIIFRSKLQSFKNFGNPDDFDYERFMKIKGYSATTYLSSSNWQKTGKRVDNISTISQRIRAKIIAYYASFNLDSDTFAFITALTIGYKNFLTDDLKESFRKSGTSHILAVSGLHVGIVFIIFSTIFSFFGKRGNMFQIRQLLIILALWFYAFITGFSPSVLRAVIMLTVYCLGSLIYRKGFTYNTVAIAAFIILIIFPYSLFDISFQMSFVAVLSILFFQPILDRLILPANRVAKYIWNLFTVSLAAQLGVFPIVLHYFGTFPTYFFIANMLIVPLVGVIIYSVISVVVFKLLTLSGLKIFSTIFLIFRWILHSLVTTVLKISSTIENLLFAQISDLYITTIQLFLVIALILSVTLFWVNKRPKYLILTLLSLIFLLTTDTFSLLNEQPTQLVVYNKTGESEIGLFHRGKRYSLDIPDNGIVPYQNAVVVHLSDNEYNNIIEDEYFPADILIIGNDKTFSISHLNKIFRPSIVVIENTLSAYYRKQLIEECNNLNIKYHDVSQDGAFIINYEL